MAEAKEGGMLNEFGSKLAESRLMNANQICDSIYKRERSNEKAIYKQN